jgi:hypothetical protein
MGKRQHASVGMIPALVFVKTDQKITVGGKTYTVLKMFYDTKGEYAPMAPRIA